MDSKMTPMMKQYLEIKKKHQDEILFFRMGDFYEMFFEDAHIASKILDIALTTRQNDVPMCGIPFHAAESYIARLIKADKRVAICEQLESVPSNGPIVRRDVVRIITPGTVIESNLLQSDDNNFLGSIIIDRKQIGLAFIDISTGDFYLSAINKTLELFRGEITKYNPREIVLLEGDQPSDETYTDFLKNTGIPIYRINEWYYDQDYMHTTICDVFGVNNTSGLGLQSQLEILTAGSILQYLKETHKQAFDHIKHPQKIVSSDRMVLDDATITNMELTNNSQDKSKKRTLFSVLNYTKTAMGRRVLERNLLEPLLHTNEIDKRLDVVQYFHEYHELINEFQDHLRNISDVERLISQFSMGKVFPRNFIAIKNSINNSFQLKNLLNAQPHSVLKDLAGSIPDLKSLAENLETAITAEPALTPEQGRIISSGYNKELDELYQLKTNAKEWILNYQEKEKKALGCSTLKIKYNKVLGYYIEISKVQATNIPDHYFRKQTLVGSERFTTEKLQKFEADILSSNDKIVSIEKAEIEKLTKKIKNEKDKIQQMANTVANIDFYCSLAAAAVENNFARPQFNNENKILIQEGRHPVVEKYYTKEVFIPNDIHLDNNENVIKIITGPNMSGKSTYIRMAAIIQLMAQTGSFVPARSADLPIVDRIFTRIGASDNISRGESTFLVEMNETANILNNATDRSLLIMDEVGRGTSTYDGLSIAWAIVEYILRYLKSKTLFATHYHELTKLGSKKGIINYNVMVSDTIKGVEFLHKVVKGAADKSYGIHVAQLAGIPKQIIGRAEKILDRLEKGSFQAKGNQPTEEQEKCDEQLEIFNAANHLVIQAIKNINLDSVTPIDALNELNRLKNLIN